VINQASPAREPTSGVRPAGRPSVRRLPASRPDTAEELCRGGGREEQQATHRFSARAHAVAAEEARNGRRRRSDGLVGHVRCVVWSLCPRAPGRMLLRACAVSDAASTCEVMRPRLMLLPLLRATGAAAAAAAGGG